MESALSVIRPSVASVVRQFGKYCTRAAFVRIAGGNAPSAASAAQVRSGQGQGTGGQRGTRFGDDDAIHPRGKRPFRWSRRTVRHEKRRLRRTRHVVSHRRQRGASGARTGTWGTGVGSGGGGVDWTYWFRAPWHLVSATLFPADSAELPSVVAPQATPTVVAAKMAACSRGARL